jgi:hypothetical protein
MMVREPAVAGQFYPGKRETLQAELARLIVPREPKRTVIGVVSPHAGYIYSGGVAGKLYGGIEIPATVVVLCPNHTGHGAPIALHPPGSWRTPLGEVPINAELAGLLAGEVDGLVEDAAAHRFEHSLEVQLPFLQQVRPDISIVPLCLGFADLARCKVLGEGMARAISRYGGEVLMVASSDMSHYEPADVARGKDRLAINRVLDLDPDGLLAVCRQQRITMCGAVPAAAMLVAARMRGAERGELVAYATSGDVTGDNREVVGYAAIQVY